MNARDDTPPDSLGYWQKRERWCLLGARVQALRAQARAEGRQPSELSGYDAAVRDFTALGRELDRRAR